MREGVTGGFGLDYCSVFFFGGYKEFLGIVFRDVGVFRSRCEECVYKCFFVKYFRDGFILRLRLFEDYLEDFCNFIF